MILIQQQRNNSIGKYYFYIYDDHVSGTMHGQIIKELSPESIEIQNRRNEILRRDVPRFITSTSVSGIGGYGEPIWTFDEASNISRLVRIDG